MKMNWFFLFNRAAFRKRIRLPERAAFLSIPQPVFWKLFMLDLPVYTLLYICHRIIFEIKNRRKGRPGLADG